MKTFSQKVVELALSNPPGRVVTYGMLAHRAGGGAMASQSITTILGKAYIAGEKNIPWHRIVYADGKIWIDDAHRAERMKLYKKEKIEIIEKNGKFFIKDFENKLWDFR
jgi:alkylated DNA nucleotide flippase Atl1